MCERCNRKGYFQKYSWSKLRLKVDREKNKKKALNNVQGIENEDIDESEQDSEVLSFT